MIYLEYDFNIRPLAPAREILVAELSELGFESFVEHEIGLLAYVQKTEIGSVDLNTVQILKNPDFQISWKSKEIEPQNWNAQWEQNFTPIRISDDCMVRAPFHSKEKVKYDIIIEPKMSFGTGHHETTQMMLQHILEHDFNRKTVLDMGCGTGVLGILAAMRGARHVDAIDIDDWCYGNTIENVNRNNCKNITAYQGGASLIVNKSYDVILANINRNILLEDLPKYRSTLTKDGLLFLSGFHKVDMPLILKKCESLNGKYESHLMKKEWVATVHQF